jgi:beta-lactamase superfamily II metal-dependent hydrolase
VSTEIPDLGVVFWPVGTGDSSTVVVTDEVLIQVDLNDRAKADDDDTPEVPVVDLLVEALPTGSVGRPFLAAFVLTHADEDHCSGFADLLGKATIGELWATPRMWREYLKDGKDVGLCKDAKAFHKEVKRRVEAVKKAVAASNEIALGDRVLVVGYDTDEHKHAYHDLPEEYLLKPGISVTKINGVDHAGRFEAFIHAPFKDDCAAARNETSLSLQVTLTEDGGQDGKVLLFGDLAYETIMKIFNYSEYYGREQYLEWNLLLAPHHCSKYVMHVREDGQDFLKTDILEAFERHARDGSVVVASSKPIPPADVDGANPPHKMAAERYKDYTDRFICTMEWPSVENPSPVVLGVDASGAQIVEDEVVELSARSAAVAKAAGRRRGRLAEVAAAATAAGRYAGGVVSVSETAVMTGSERVQAAIKADRGSDAAPTTAVGFGSG